MIPISRIRTTFAMWTVSLLSTLVLVRPGGAQMPTPSLSPQLPRSGISNSPSQDDPLENNQALRDRIERSRAAERQRRIVESARRLVELTVQYQYAIAEHGTATADDQKLLLQIEKLAREVKDRMRGM